MKVHEKLAHLTPEQLDDLMERYQGKEKVAALIEEFGIDTSPGNLIYLFPPILHEDLFCQYCKDTNLVSNRAPRTGYSSRSQTSYCLECGHDNSERCLCEICIEKENFAQEEAAQRESDIIKAAYTREVETPSVDNITLKDAVFILALARHSLTEDLRFVEPFKKDEVALAPLYECQNDIVTHLSGEGFITISPDSPVDAFIFDPAETCLTGYVSDRVLWEFLPGLDTGDKCDYIKSLQTVAGEDEWPDAWRADVPTLWHHIAKYECLEFFLHLLAQRGYLPYTIGEKTHTTFDNLLADFPVSIIFNLSWMAVRDTIDFIARNNISRNRGKNIFIGAIQRKADKAKAEGWDLRHFRQNFSYPQTVVSATFFNLFLELGDSAFETVPPRIDGTWCRT